MKQFTPPPTFIPTLDGNGHFSPQWLKWFNDIGNRAIFYGSFYSMTSQIVTGANTPTAVNFEKIWTNSNVDNPTRTSKIVFTQDGTYRFRFTGDVITSDATNRNVWFWLRKNGVDVPNSTAKAMTSQNLLVRVGLNFSMAVAGGEYVEVWWASDTANMTMQIGTYAGANPDSPSAVFEALQIDLWSVYQRTK